MESSPGDCLEAVQPSVGTLCVRSAVAGLALWVTPESWCGVNTDLFWEICIDASWRKSRLLVLCKIGCTCVWFENASHSIYSLWISFSECYDSQWQLLPKAMQILSINIVSAVSEISGNFPIAINGGRIGLNTNTQLLNPVIFLWNFLFQALKDLKVINFVKLILLWARWSLFGKTVLL